MNAQDLIVGEAYFQFTFQRAKFRKPIILSYEYVEQAKPEGGYFEEGYVFRYLPAFQYEMEDGEMFPGDDEETFFTPKQIESLVDLQGLIHELTYISKMGNE